MRYLRLWRLFALTELQFELAYRVNFVLGFVEMFLVVGTSIAAVLVLFSHTSALNGWSLDQMLVLLGVYYLIQGAVNLVLTPSFERLMEHVRLGTLDFLLLKPVNAQFLVSTRHLRVVRGMDLLLGVAVLVVGLSRIGDQLSPVPVLLFVLTLGLGLIAVYAMLLALVTLSFWFVRVENLLAIFWAFTDAGRFPVDIYPGWLRLTLSTVVPIGIAVTAPAEAVVGSLGLGTFVLLASGTVAAFAFAAWFWRLGLRSYTGASA